MSPLVNVGIWSESAVCWGPCQAAVRREAESPALQELLSQIPTPAHFKEGRDTGAGTSAPSSGVQRVQTLPLACSRWPSPPKAEHHAGHLGIDKRTALVWLQGA